MITLQIHEVVSLTSELREVNDGRGRPFAVLRLYVITRGDHLGQDRFEVAMLAIQPELAKALHEAIKSAQPPQVEL